MSDTFLKLGVIGSGQISGILMPMLADKDIRPTALTDLNLDAARALAEKIGEHVVVHDSADALLASPDVDVIYVATPPSSHAPLTRQALEAGKHVLCEKPWMATVEEARDIAETCARHPELKVASCASRFRFAQSSDLCRESVSANKLGPLRWARLCATLNAPKDASEIHAWKLKPGISGGGLVGDWGVYELEWLRGTLGHAFQPVSVYALFDYWKREEQRVESGYQILIECEGNLTCHINRSAEIGPLTHGISLRGDTGGIDAPFAPNHSNTDVVQHHADNNGKIVSETIATNSTDWGDILVGPFIDLADAINNDTPVAADPESQLFLQRLLTAVYTSADKGEVVKFRGF